jgi:hypothetical protein
MKVAWPLGGCIIDGWINSVGTVWLGFRINTLISLINLLGMYPLLPRT